MKELWAPWRIEYFKKAKGKGCFLCKSFASSRDRDNLILKRGKTCVVLMNRYPYTSGHLMVAPGPACGDYGRYEAGRSSRK